MSCASRVSSPACHPRRLAAASTTRTRTKANQSAERRGNIGRVISDISRRLRCAATSDASRFPTTGIDASFDETFCIMDMGCEHTLRRLSGTESDVTALDELLKTAQFETNGEEWRDLLRRTIGADGSTETTTGPCTKHSIRATGVFDERDVLVGVCTSINYGAFGHLGNLVVSEKYRGRGVASMLVNDALFEFRDEKVRPWTFPKSRHTVCLCKTDTFLSQSKCKVAWLDASDMGLRMYENIGFEKRSLITQWSKEIKGGDAGEGKGNVRTVNTASTTDPATTLGGIAADQTTREEFAALNAMDTAVFGADRKTLLKAWFDTSPNEFCVVDKDTGYALAHTRGEVVYLGPWGFVDAGGGKRNATEREKFVADAIRKVEDDASRKGGVKKLVAYVPSPLGIQNGMTYPTFTASEGMDIALEKAGFTPGEITTRMAMCLEVLDGDVERQLREPGAPNETLAVASLDLG